jgi:hypothetical protein
MAFQSTKCILDTHVFFEQAFERTEYLLFRRRPLMGIVRRHTGAQVVK